MAHVRVIRNGLFVAAIATLLVACGGGDSTETATAPVPNAPSPPAPEVVTGIATPDSVAVVTATNAN